MTSAKREDRQTLKEGQHLLYSVLRHKESHTHTETLAQDETPRSLSHFSPAQNLTQPSSTLCSCSTTCQTPCRKKTALGSWSTSFWTALSLSLHGGTSNLGPLSVHHRPLPRRDILADFAVQRGRHLQLLHQSLSLKTSSLKSPTSSTWHTSRSRAASRKI